MRKMVRSAVLVGSVVLLGALTACAPQRHVPTGDPPNATPYPASAAVGTEYGRVHQIEVLPGCQRAQTSGAGAVIGAVWVVCWVIRWTGQRQGRSHRRGCDWRCAGNAIEGSSGGTGADQSYRLTIQFDWGITAPTTWARWAILCTGDRVRVQRPNLALLSTLPYAPPLLWWWRAVR